MKHMFYYLLFMPLLSLGFSGSVHPPSASGSLKIIIDPVFGKQPLILSTQPYVSGSGDTVFIDVFRFYMSGLKLKNSNNGIVAENDSYHLVDAVATGSLTITFTDIPEGTYSTLNFLLGVDSLANVSGAMSGDLDPAKAMYWAWNTGYIMAKLEGHSSTCPALHHAFEFHIGGYLPPYQTARKISLALPSLKIEGGQERIIHVKADAGEWFISPSAVRLKETNNVTVPGKEACRIADNYSDMFSIQEGAGWE
jgi:hypothetical protein